ncbi:MULTISPECIES: recombinase family protein [Nonomuraea]|uniref:Recombinase family protein n=1 Tax=Nonomuraea mangrovi TaxID=2316207 RepID=A0ABW4T8U6_9ACTN
MEAVGDQFAFMEATVDRLGGDVAEHFSDLGRPGEGLRALMRAAYLGRFDRVMAWSLDRFGWAHVDLVATLTTLRDTGARVTMAGTDEDVDGAYVAYSISLAAADSDVARRVRAARRRRGEAR